MLSDTRTCNPRNSSNRKKVTSVVRANTEAMHFIKTNREESKAIFSKYLNLKDPEGLDRAVRAYGRIFPEVPTPAPEGVKTLLDDLAPRNPKAQVADPRLYVDLTFVRELESSGFINQRSTAVSKSSLAKPRRWWT